jgi:hypothetical protein
VAGEGRVAVEIDQIHGAANQIADARTHAIEYGGRQAGNGEVEIGSGGISAMGGGAEDINLASTGGLEGGCGALDQYVSIGTHIMMTFNVRLLCHEVKGRVESMIDDKGLKVKS